ncbi:MAG: hypothetical protein Tsb0016_08660 [Sphingomonadales bacterium]
MSSVQANANAVREAVAVFKDSDALQAAIDDLLSHGFDRADLSLLADERVVEEKLHRHFIRARELEDDPKAPRVAFVSPEAIGDAQGALIGTPMYIAAGTAAGAMTAVGGPLAAVIAATIAASGAGALLGGVLATLLGKHHSHYLEEQLAHGGLLLWVRTWDTGDEQRATDILKKHAGGDVHVHDIPTTGD